MIMSMKKYLLKRDWFLSKVILLAIFGAHYSRINFVMKYFFLRIFACNMHIRLSDQIGKNKFPLPELDKNVFPSIIHDGKIYAGMHEVINCEEETQSFYLFLILDSCHRVLYNDFIPNNLSRDLSS